MDTLISIRKFVQYHPNIISVTGMTARIKAAGLVPVKKPSRRDGGWLYSQDDLVAILSRPRQGRAGKPQPLSASRPRQGRAGRPKPLPTAVPLDWVPFPSGTRLRVTNCAGRILVGIFIGYKGDVLANLKLVSEVTIFAMDAKLEPVSDDEPLSFSDPVIMPRQNFFSFLSTEKDEFVSNRY